jgi:hypothetical protein
LSQAMQGAGCNMYYTVHGTNMFASLLNLAIFLMHSLLMKLHCLFLCYVNVYYGISYYLEKQIKWLPFMQVGLIKLGCLKESCIISVALKSSVTFQHAAMPNGAKIVVVLISRRFFDIRPPCIDLASKKIFCNLMLPLLI